MAAMMFWTCPVRAHETNKNAQGQNLPTVEWSGDVAHCLTPGCILTNEPGEIVVEAEVYYPTGTGPGSPAALDPRDFAAEVVAHPSGMYRVQAGPRMVSNKSYEFELHPELEDSPEAYLFPREHARHVASIMANKRAINGKNYHEWVLENAQNRAE